MGWLLATLATRPLLAGYSPSIYMCGSPKTRRYLLNKSKNTINLETKYKTSKQRFICISRIPTPGCQSMRKCVEVYRLQYEKNLHNTCMENTCKNENTVKLVTRGHLCIQAKVSLHDRSFRHRFDQII